MLLVFMRQAGFLWSMRSTFGEGREHTVQDKARGYLSQVAERPLWAETKVSNG